MALSQRVLSSHLEPKTIGVRKFELLSLRLKQWLARNRFQEPATQFPYVVRVLALLLSNGLPITVAIAWLAPRLSGLWSQVFREISQRIELGSSLEAELEQLAIEIPLSQVQEFCQKLQIAFERGVPMAPQLQNLADSLEASTIRDLTRRSGANETKMLIPTVFLILPITVLFAVFPSLLVLQASY
jgi:tight adherence protein C